MLESLNTKQFQYRMNYNQLTYYHANPFYKQDFLPDRAWFNRQAKKYPSEIPSGKDFFTDNGRKHFKGQFNHSEIQQQKILKSPQKYPFQNRIALDKTYMRNLQTIDIQGASSNTRINQSIKNKFKARDELSRRYNQSVEINKNTEQEKRRQIALKNYQSYNQKGQNKISDENMFEQSRTSNTSSNYGSGSVLNKAELSEQYKRYIMQISNNKFHKNKPIAQYPQHLRLQNYTKNYQTLEPSMSSDKNYQTHQPNYQNPEVEQRFKPKLQTQIQKQMNKNVLVQDKSSPVSYYKNQFNSQKLRNSEQYQKILKYQEMSRRILKNPNDFRKNSPTNLSLSFNLAGQNIVSS